MQASADGRQRVGFTVTNILHKPTHAFVAQGQATLLPHSPIQRTYTAMDAVVGVTSHRVRVSSVNCIGTYTASCLLAYVW